MNNRLFILLLPLVLQPAFAADPVSRDDLARAWLDFTSARGEASLIRGDVEHPSANQAFRVIPDVMATALDEAKLQLGADLFHESRLSRDGSISCASCHIALMGGVDRRPIPVGIGGAEGTLNAPTIFNAALNFRQFWDGRALTLQEQALGPIQNAVEFGHDLEGAVAVLNSLPDYASAFDALYGDGITAANLGDAIAYYETMNFTGISSPFLRQFAADGEPLSRQAQRGQQRFVEVGCTSCHNGVNLGGNSYQPLGIAKAWYGADRPAREADAGLFGRTGREQDRHVFKVPTLHNVAITGPWMHDGSITSLQQAVDWMARYELGRYLENEDIDDIVAFLRSLGDSLGMLGDCAASGSYTVTMECNMKQRTSAAVTDTTANQLQREIDLTDADAVASVHQAEYAAALLRVEQAPDKISAEMRRISSGEVAHYDFLQYEHIEMLRHARALDFPPATLEQAERETLLQSARKWQQLAARYELDIADFLRNQAVIGSAKANTLDLLRILAIDADEKARTLLANVQQSAVALFQQPDQAAMESFVNALQPLLALELNPQLKEELTLQVRLLMENISISQV